MSETSPLDPATREAWDYLVEVVGDYERYMTEIGNLGLAAPNLLYYRDEIQEGLDQFKTERRVDFRSVWERVKALDDYLRGRAEDLVKEIGHKNFNQYRIINDPPKAYWWWYLDRVTPAPPPAPPTWQFWRHLQLKTQTQADLVETSDPAAEPPPE